MDEFFFKFLAKSFIYFSVLRMNEFLLTIRVYEEQIVQPQFPLCQILHGSPNVTAA